MCWSLVLPGQRTSFSSFLGNEPLLFYQRTEEQRPHFETQGKRYSSLTVHKGLYANPEFSDIVLSLLPEGPALNLEEYCDDNWGASSLSTLSLWQNKQNSDS